jgi:hypothetical protein
MNPIEPMKRLTKTSTQHFWLVVPTLLIAFALAGCAVFIHHSDPLAGFSSDFKILDQVIVNDYQHYIHNLSPLEERNLGPYPADFYEDETGQHAVEIKIGINGTVWRHVLIYDKDNKRIKTIKYASGNYGS